MLYDHLAALRRQPFLQNCRFMLIPEANLGDQAQLLAQVALRRFRDVDVMCDTQGCYGIFTRPGQPEKYVFRMRDKLAERGLFFHNKMVCVNPYQPNLTAAQKLEKAVREFKRQLVAFRAIHIVPASLRSRVQLIYSGKADKDNKRSNRAKDDMCMALLFGYYYYTQYISLNNLVNTRDSYNMLRLEAGGGTVLEGGTEYAVPNKYANNAQQIGMRKRKAAGH